MFTTISINKTLTFEELQEVLKLAKHQETTDKLTNTTLEIAGDHATISAEIDEEGNITIL